MFKTLKYLFVTGVFVLIFSTSAYFPHTTSKPYIPAPTGNMDHLNEITAYMKAYADKIVKMTPVDNKNTGGTGFEINSKSGEVYTITNNHVCNLSDNGKMLASWDNGTSEELKIIEQDPAHDLCILSGLKNKTGLPLSKFPAEIYEGVFVIGHPLLQPNTYSEGYIRDRSLVDLVDEKINTKEACEKAKKIWKSVDLGLFGSMDLCVGQFDDVGTSVVGYPGNSGSPVFNTKGEVVGVIFVGDTDTNYLGYVPYEYLTALLAKY